MPLRFKSITPGTNNIMVYAVIKQSKITDLKLVHSDLEGLEWFQDQFGSLDRDKRLVRLDLARNDPSPKVGDRVVVDEDDVAELVRPQYRR